MDVKTKTVVEHGEEDYQAKWMVMMAVGMSIFMSTVDFSIVNVSLPTLVEDLHTDFATVQWVIISYTLVITSTMLSVARLGDIYGKKKLYFWGLALFTFSSFLCGLAPSAGWLIGFRALQGAGAALTQALGTAIVSEVFPARERGKAMGIIGSIVAVGLSMGPALGGVIIGLLNWRAVFLVNVPIGLIAGFFTLRYIPASRRIKEGERFDYPGAALMFAALFCYALGLTLGQRQGFGNATAWSLLTFSVLSLGLFIYTEFRVKQPMLEPVLFKNILFSLNLIMAFLVFIVMSSMFIMPFFLEVVQGYQTQYVGLFMMVTPVTMGLIAPLAGSLSDRFGSRGISLAGLIVTIVGCITISTLHKNVTPIGYILRLAPLGVGMGLFQSPNNSAIMGAVPRHRLGVASGLMALSRNLGNSSGIPLMGALFTHQVMVSGNLPVIGDLMNTPHDALIGGVNGVFRIAAVVIFVSTCLAGLALWKDRRREKADALQ